MTGDPAWTPRASVLLSTRLTGPWRESLDSVVRGQSFTEHEVVAVVDAPEGPVDELKARYADAPHVRVLLNERNLGLTASLNRGLAAARGAVVVRHDDDDISRPERLRRLLEHLDRHPETTLVSSFAEAFSRQSGVESRWLQKTPLTHEAIVSALDRRNCIIHPSIAMRTEPLRALGGYDERFRLAQDYDLYLRAVRAGWRFACLPEPLVERSYSEQSITVTRRYEQATYSMAAKLLFRAGDVDRSALTRDVLQYLRIIATPQWARTARRVLSGLPGLRR